MKKFFSAVALSLLSILTVSPASADEVRGRVYSKTWDIASTVDAAQATTTLAAPGAALGDACLPSLSVSIVLVSFTCYVSSANIVTFVFQNESGATIDPASATVRAFVISKGTR